MDALVYFDKYNKQNTDRVLNWLTFEFWENQNSLILALILLCIFIKFPDSFPVLEKWIQKYFSLDFPDFHWWAGNPASLSRCMQIDWQVTKHYFKSKRLWNNSNLFSIKWQNGQILGLSMQSPKSHPQRTLSPSQVPKKHNKEKYNIHELPPSSIYTLSCPLPIIEMSSS